MTRPDTVRTVLYWAAMIVLASLWAKLHPPRSGTFASELIAYGPFVLIALLAAFVWWYDGKHKQRAQLEETQPYAKRLSVHCGIGYDLHRLAEGRKLIIGGIEVPFEKGPVGHSDGDVVAHALCDALLGAAGLGDMGTHFPDSDPQWKGANSLLFLEHARKLLDEKHFAIEYVDAVVILERPKLGPHFPKMREALAKSLRVPVEKIHLKAKTNEGVDAVGRGEAIAAHVIATISTP